VPIKKATKQKFKHKQKTYEYDKENNIWHLSEEDKRIAKKKECHMLIISNKKNVMMII